MEQWKTIPDTDNKYEISSFGRIKSARRVCPSKSGSTQVKRERILKGSITSCGYRTQVLYHCNGVKKNWLVHRLVALAFIPVVKNKHFVNHKNGIKLENNLDNLEWCNRKENAQHALSLGLYKHTKGEDAPNSKLKNKQVEHIIKLLKEKNIPSEIQDITGVNYKIISSINRGKTWKHLTNDIQIPIYDTSKMQDKIGRRRSKLSDNDLIKIKEMRKNGMTQQKIADHFCITQVYVSDILRS